MTVKIYYFHQYIFSEIFLHKEDIATCKSRID